LLVIYVSMLKLHLLAFHQKQLWSHNHENNEPRYMVQLVCIMTLVHSKKAPRLISLSSHCNFSSLAVHMLRISIVTQPCLTYPLRFEYDE
jgi:hypothetical protein